MKKLTRPLVVMALVKVNPDAEGAFQDAAAGILAVTRQEPGCLSYSFHQSVDNPQEFAFSEKWESEEHLQNHLKTPHMQAFFKATSPMFQPGFPVLKRFNTLDV